MNIEDIKKRAIAEVAKLKSASELDQIYIRYLGRKGEVAKVLKSLKNLSGQDKAKLGKAVNQVKQELAQLFAQAKKNIIKQADEAVKGKIDVTAPGKPLVHGHIHPIAMVQKQVEEIFKSMGFSVIYGPEMETEYYNFDALNIPKDHPARDQWDTFWLKDVKKLLRTHTSPMQARFMEKNDPPLRIIVPGRCFRHEATDASHSDQFYQVEGLMVGDDISVANFKAIIETFLQNFFGKDIEMRLRPSYFPFTEPSFEVDMKWSKGDWLEIMGAGMVHQNVLTEAGYPRGKYQGFAFGMGLDRLAMLKYKIDDIRLFYGSDLKFLKQF